jgi:ubiquinone/menaquinone biosynthesis C-methylase UbiE
MSKLHLVDSSFSSILEKIPKRNKDEPHPYWVHSELIERYQIIKTLNIQKGMNILEIGCGPHALSSIVLAYFVGESGRIIAVDKSRWHSFEELVSCVNYKKRILPLQIDAQKLPIPYRSFDYSTIIHGVRSMGNDETLKGILKEMFRISSCVIIAESLPIANSKAQKAHLEMYNLREEVFEAVYGKKDDLKYRPMEELIELVESVGEVDIKTKKLELDMPHFLALFPKELVLKIKDQQKRNGLIHRWEAAYRKIEKYGEAHPPIGIVAAKDLSTRK